MTSKCAICARIFCNHVILQTSLTFLDHFTFIADVETMKRLSDIKSANI